MEHKDVEEVAAKMHRSANILAKWRSVFTGWHLGTRSTDDGQTKAMRDLYEKVLLMRAELNGVTRILVDKGVVTQVELTEIFGEEYAFYAEQLAGFFDGMEATEQGIAMDPGRAAETMRRLGFPQ